MSNEEPVPRIRGTQDFCPVDYYLRERAWKNIQSVFEKFGYQGIEVPIIEHTELHTKKSGEEIRRHMYHFIDLGERDICLRPEITASVVRAFNTEMSTEPLPVRLYYFGPAFRYDKPQEGRYRQFTQAGIECLGGDGLECDAEVIQIARLGLEAIGIKDYYCVIGHLGIISQFLNSFSQLSPQIKSFFIESFEDLSKAPTLEEGLANMKEDFFKIEGAANIKNEVLDVVLSFISELCRISGKPEIVFKKLENLIGRYSHIGLTSQPLSELKEIVTYLNTYGVDWENTRIDFGFGRGLTYYTGMIFQLHCPNLGAANQVCGGGRYDGLVEFMGGREPVKAVGFAYGFERIVLSFQKSLPPRLKGYDGKMEVAFVEVMVVPIGNGGFLYAIQVAQQLRANGIRVEIGSFGKKAKKLTSRANLLQIPYVIFIGDEEKNSKTVKIKEMSTGKEIVLNYMQLEDFACDISSKKPFSK